MSKGGFFAVGKPQFQSAVALGLNPAVALLVLARGTGKDNITTAWSAEAVGEHTGITWRRAKAAIDALEQNGIAVLDKPGARPIRKLQRPTDDAALIWLPNELIDGAGQETPPVTKLRQAQDVSALQLLVELYHDQELAGDGGLPRSMVRGKFERTKIADFGQFEMTGFTRDQSVAWGAGALSRFWNKSNSNGQVWPTLQVLIGLGLLELVDYLAESDSDDAELIHALNGDSHAIAVADAASELADALPGGFKYEAVNYDYALPIPRHMTKATMVGVYRLKYRPKTKRTAAWYAEHVKACGQASELYKRLLVGQFSKAA